MSTLMHPPMPGTLLIPKLAVRNAVQLVQKRQQIQHTQSCSTAPTSKDIQSHISQTSYMKTSASSSTTRADAARHCTDIHKHRRHLQQERSSQAAQTIRRSQQQGSWHSWHTVFPLHAPSSNWCMSASSSNTHAWSAASLLPSRLRN
eukprot:1154514-Pelagomonas_calceolata.AAC.2